MYWKGGQADVVGLRESRHEGMTASQSSQQEATRNVPSRARRSAILQRVHFDHSLRPAIHSTAKHSLEQNESSGILGLLLWCGLVRAIDETGELLSRAGGELWIAWCGQCIKPRSLCVEIVSTILFRISNVGILYMNS
jgi:hypothetical protein